MNNEKMALQWLESAFYDILVIEGRYPGDFGLLPDGKPTLFEAKEFYSFAKNIYGKVKAFLENGSNDSE